MATRGAHAFTKIIRSANRCHGASSIGFCTKKLSTSCYISRNFITATSTSLPSVSNKNFQNFQHRYFASDQNEPSIEEQTMDVLKLFDKVDPSKVTIEAHFLNDLGLDSLDVVEVVMAFEDEFGIEISDEEAEKVFTVQQAAELIKAKLDS